jgi:hypothetical protein
VVGDVLRTDAELMEAVAGAVPGWRHSRMLGYRGFHGGGAGQRSMALAHGSGRCGGLARSS